MVITGKNSKSFWSTLQLILLTRHFRGVNSSKASQMCHIIVYSSNYLKKHWQIIHFFKKKKMANMIIIPWWWSKHDNKNMVSILWSCHESWRPCQETWPPCHYHGMAVMFFQRGNSMRKMIMLWFCFKDL